MVSDAAFQDAEGRGGLRLLWRLLVGTHGGLVQVSYLTRRLRLAKSLA